MRENYLIEKSSIKGNAIALIIIFSGFIILFLTVFSSVFDKALSKVMIQEITDKIDQAGYEFYHHVNFTALSHKDVSIKDSMINSINHHMIKENPQIEEFKVVNIRILEDNILELEAYILLGPTLYREVFNIHHPYYFKYYLKLPVDFGGIDEEANNKNYNIDNSFYIAYDI